MPPLTGRTLLWIAVSIVVLTAAIVTALWWAGTRGLTGDQLVTARFDALKIGLSVGVGSGGLLALYLAWRRQRSTEDTLAHQQEVALDNQADALERRITELYTKAAEQLGSGKAPVRLAGLYALERLAQGTESQRQTIVNLLCAYLRMPDEVGGTQEREVRLTAQRILAHHQRPGFDSEHPAETFWPDVDLDLTGATLVDADFSHCRLRAPRLGGVTFAGPAGFDETTFLGDARFEDVTFTAEARFDNATFTRNAWFDGVVFTGKAGFEKAAFARNALFRGVTFPADAVFRGGGFAKNAWFGKATFTGNADFREATVAKTAQFSGTTFSGDAWFGKASFAGNSDFRGATFTRNAVFREAAFTMTALFCGAAFRQEAGFRGAAFAMDADFSGAVFSGDVRFIEAIFSRDTEFRGAAFDGEAGFRGVTFSRSPRLQRVKFANGIPSEVAQWVSPAEAVPD
ncbi:hypothetical protein GCM10017788_78340 [Amycolatopsis acidiphila]|nr:hypothetical protein GCM10017788_78340 [Amycolatopsis acidiphila]